MNNVKHVLCRNWERALLIFKMRGEDTPNLKVKPIKNAENPPNYTFHDPSYSQKNILRIEKELFSRYINGVRNEPVVARIEHSIDSCGNHHNRVTFFSPNFEIDAKKASKLKSVRIKLTKNGWVNLEIGVGVRKILVMSWQQSALATSPLGREALDNIADYMDVTTKK